VDLKYAKKFPTPLDTRAESSKLCVFGASICAPPNVQSWLRAWEWTNGKMVVKKPDAIWAIRIEPWYDHAAQEALCWTLVADVGRRPRSSERYITWHCPTGMQDRTRLADQWRRKRYRA